MLGPHTQKSKNIEPLPIVYIPKYSDENGDQLTKL